MLKTAVIGVGYLGRFHAQKYAALAESELVGVVDVDYVQGQKVADEIGVPVFNDFHEVLDLVDAVSIVVPTVHHFETAKAFMEKGVHVLLEKPFAANIEEAEELEQLSRGKNLRLQIGHLERFNPVFTEFQELIDRPKFIENIRIAPFPKRGTDVDVILDLMIHDIDLVLDLVNDTVVRVDASGASVVSSFIDLANARLTFKNGVVANLTASRVSDKQMRQMRIFEKNCYSALDLQASVIKSLVVDDNKKIQNKLIKVEKNNALFLELESFVMSIITDTKTVVSGNSGLCALKIATKIQNIIEKQKNN